MPSARSLLFGGLLVCALSLPAATAPAKTIKAELGKPFTLLKSQRAKLKGTDAVLRITGFINSPCPKDARCIWSGLRVDFELAVAGTVVPLDEKAPFIIELKDSDYTTRAQVVVSARPTEKK